VRKFGVEVEFGGNRDAVVNAMREAGLSCDHHSYMGHSATGWVVKTDGSVPNGGELVSPPLDFDNEDERGQLRKAMLALQAAGARTIEQAGVHVHVDASDLDAQQVAAVARVFTKFEDCIYRIASSGWRTIRSGARSYCKPLPEATVKAIAKVRTRDQLERAWYGRAGGAGTLAGHGHQSRYHGLNLHSWFYRGTIEFRVFNSTMNPERVQAYVALCVALVHDARKGNRRSVNKAYRLGGMAAGTTKADNAFHRLLQVVRYEADMSVEDMKRLRKVWKDSVPQAAFTGSW
jgi:hypothetical protein